MSDNFPSERLYTIQLSSEELKDVQVSIDEHHEDNERTDISINLLDKIDAASALEKEDQDIAEIVKVSKEVTVTVRTKLKELTEA